MPTTAILRRTALATKDPDNLNSKPDGKYFTPEDPSRDLCATTSPTPKGYLLILSIQRFRGHRRYTIEQYGQLQMLNVKSSPQALAELVFPPPRTFSSRMDLELIETGQKESPTTTSSDNPLALLTQPWFTSTVLSILLFVTSVLGATFILDTAYKQKDPYIE
ncbi:MAG: hypothetical protein Q9208_000519 [Pyrenodesmia sp. 3 TL-2023]